MITKKEMKRIYQEQKSINRIEASFLQKAIEKIEYEQSRGFDIKLNQKNIVDYAYDNQF